MKNCKQKSLEWGIESSPTENLETEDMILLCFREKKSIRESLWSLSGKLI